MSKSTSKRSAGRPRRFRLFFHRDGDRAIFLPSPAMWFLHEASTMASIGKRAALDQAEMARIRHALSIDKTGTLESYLFGADTPREVKLIYPDRWGISRVPREGELFAGLEIRKFRATGCRKRVVKAAQEALDDHEANDPRKSTSSIRRFGLGCTTVSTVIDQASGLEPAEREWVKRWTFRGGRESSDPRGDGPLRGVKVCVITLQQIELLWQAFDYGGLCGEHGAACQVPGYPKWLDSFPAENGKQLAVWIMWLFGRAEPAGWLIISEEMLGARQARTFAETCKRAKANPQNVAVALKQPAVGHAIREAIAAGSRIGKETSFQRLDAIAILEPQRRRMLWRYVQASREEAVLRHAGASGANKKSVWLSRAQQVGGDACRELVRAFVAGEELPGWRDPRARGVIGEGLFLPSPGMIEFRELAARRQAGTGVASILSKLEARTTKACVERLALHLAVPRPIEGRTSRAWELATALEGEEWALACRESAGLLSRGTSSPCRNEPDRGKAEAPTAANARKPPSNGRYGIDATAFDEAMTAALRMCIGQNQTKLVESLAILTRDDGSVWPVADLIAVRAGFKAADKKVYRNLKKLESRNAVKRRKGKQGWRIVGT